MFRVSVTVSASLVKLRRRIMFKNKTLPWKTPKPNIVAFFVLIAGWLSHFKNLSFVQTFRKRGHHVVTFVRSCAVMPARNIPGYAWIGNQSERAKHYSTGLAYSNGKHSIEPRYTEGNNCFSITQQVNITFNFFFIFI